MNVLVVITMALLMQAAGRNQGRISPDEVTDMLAKQYDCERQEVMPSHFEYFDFIGDGNDELVIVASTCMTGTAGPDVHAVYTRNGAGKIVELPFQRVEGQSFFSTSKSKLPLFGNRNYTLSVEKGLLVARWGDSSDRKEPLVIWYKWNGSAFVVDHMKQSGPFKTSYDCAKASKEIEQAICYSEKVAALDLQLGDLYRERSQNLQPPQRAALQEQQRAWLAEREKKCVIYKWWVDCLSELYTNRIAELRQQTN